LNSATIGWATDEPATSLVDYGTTSSYGSSSPLDPTLVTNHSVALSGLAANTLYHYRVKSTDASGNPASSGDFTFSTAAIAQFPAGVNAYWQFNESSGTSTADATGHGNTGTLSSGATFASGYEANAVHFDGVNGAVRV